MASLNDRAQVKEQYKTSANLNTRISIHAKYSINKQGFGKWIYDQYRFCENDRILEPGCGNGGMWTNHELPEGLRNVRGNAVNAGFFYKNSANPLHNSGISVILNAENLTSILTERN